MKIALATFKKLPLLTKHESKLHALFAKKGIVSQSVVWSDPNIDWRIFDWVIIRSCWDYHKRINEFIKWLDYLETLSIKILNPSQVIRKNSQKTYLQELALLDVNTIPTYWLNYEEIKQVPKILHESGWEKAVIKPIISATAYKTFQISLEGIHSLLPKIAKAFPDELFMLQKFMPEIQTLGEWSLVFLNKKYSHAALKEAKAGEFRVQAEYGGSTQLKQAPDELVTQAQRILSLYEEPLLYARVDGLWIDNKFYLMEMELTEPELFLENELLRNRFVDAFEEIVRAV